jgi:hypothetical protein
MASRTHARTHLLPTMSVFFLINRARAAAAARAVWIAPHTSAYDGGLTSNGLTVAASHHKRGRPREVDAQLQPWDRTWGALRGSGRPQNRENWVKNRENA